LEGPTPKVRSFSANTVNNPGSRFKCGRDGVRLSSFTGAARQLCGQDARTMPALPGARFPMLVCSV